MLVPLLLALTAAAHAAPEWREPAELGDLRARLIQTKALAADEPERERSAAQALLDRKRSDLEALYRSSGPGPLPDGASRGFAAIAPGTPAGGATEAVFSLFWHGKIFDRQRGVLINRLTVGHLVKAKVFIGPSLLDGKPSVIIDYKDTSWLAGAIRDEIREVAPGVYLGFAFVRDENGGAPRADIVFALDFNPAP